MSTYYFFFILCGLLAVASAIVTITARNPITAALSLVFHFFMLAGLYLTLNAQFIAVVQVLVYAGAIMVLVVFVIMLLNIGKEEKALIKANIRVFLSVVFSGLLIIILTSVFLSANNAKSGLSANSIYQGTVQQIGNELFRNYLFPFEAVSLLLLVAIVGAVILAKRKID